jgi:hypothetical protein
MENRVIQFTRDMDLVLRFIDRTEENMEARAIISGICFVGPDIMINTRQAKNLLNRCKSSVNGMLMELGFVATKPRAKGRPAILTALPSIERSPGLVRQWSVRSATDRALFCFLSRFPHTAASLDPMDPDSDPYAVPIVFKIESLLAQPVRAEPGFAGGMIAPLR